MRPARSVRPWLALLMLGVIGCGQRCFMTAADFHHYRDLASTGFAPLEASCEVGPTLCPSPATTVQSPALPKRAVSLPECIAIALENGRTGQLLGGRSSVTGDPPWHRRVAEHSDLLRVFAYEPALYETEVIQSLAKFDARWVTSMAWNRVDIPVATATETDLADGQAAIKEDKAAYRTGLLQPLPTGGLAGITFRTDYEETNLNARVNPSYRPVLGFTFEQPLLRDAGIWTNLVLDSHPGGIRTPFRAGGRVPGILLARINQTRAALEFERQLHEVIFAVEEAYWDLHLAYSQLQTREEAVRFAQEVHQSAKERREAKLLDQHDFAQIEAQLQAFQRERLRAYGQGRDGRPGVLEAERRLRYVLGLAAEDGCRLVPADSPATAPVQPDWCVALAEAMARRPELLQVRESVHAAQLVVAREQNGLLPDLRFFAGYDVNDVGTRLDGPGPNGAISNLFENRFNNWELGVRLDVPLGFREARAEFERARLRLAQLTAHLHDQESKVSLDLLRSYREIVERWQTLALAKAEREAAANALEGRRTDFRTGPRPGYTMNILVTNLLAAQRDWANAVTEEQRAIAAYKIALADFEQQKGTILEYANVSLCTGPVPACAVPQASQYLAPRENTQGGDGAPEAEPMAP